ncbi:protein of unknown function DUF574 [Parafrankia sp. EAN1pec]|uniref:SAM-dependent methyltransferase n=1 Tax=Parafrankia sp. (strain EAN1pec) TaxID=298653 RepID=UPI0000543E77|nr:protein of unknown function DUF574 [Frankia sp. EAN1pec]
MRAKDIAPAGPEGLNVARVYDFFLGGAHNFPADREAAAKVEQTWPQIRDTALVNRLFLGEAVRYLAAGQVGVRQFLDIGSDITTTPFRLRSRDEVLRFFDGCELVEPGLVLLPGWDEDRQRRQTTVEGRLPVYAGVGRIR